MSDRCLDASCLKVSHVVLAHRRLAQGSGRRASSPAAARAGGAGRLRAVGARGSRGGCAGRRWRAEGQRRRGQRGANRERWPASEKTADGTERGGGGGQTPRRARHGVRDGERREARGVARAEAHRNDGKTRRTATSVKNFGEKLNPNRCEIG
ncbi:hypothetical protein BRADI_3g04071v3 [Brachypodium distachyon]|uniref:Uncharacterized protein n=1 Tax=Brachypodium distachyon TaxID=15368 RepID=A0A0Q3J4Z2_BRADI|nr:hypothetical protein BRADI_3g04071v3 [Brachypodium distachyon]